MDVAPEPTTNLTWANVGLSIAFILVNVFISTIFRLNVGDLLLIAACRCIAQLAFMCLILRNVFESNNPWAVGGITFILNLLGTFEAVATRSKKRFDHMFLSVLVSMLGSTIPVSIIGAQYAMTVDPFWTPRQYIPIVGILCGTVVSGVVVGVSYILKETYDNQDKLETYLAFGASRFEASLPIVREALQLALTPNINQMNVMGIISIPGMMTGAILGGTSIEQAMKLQIIIAFMRSASTGLATMAAIVLTLCVIVDSEDRVRPERIDVQIHAIWRARNWVLTQIIDKARHLARPLSYRRQNKSAEPEWEMMNRGPAA